jgi:pimeloyl-ACP methyl ester carboxylesterase
MDCDLGNIKVRYQTFGKGRPVIVIHGKPEVCSQRAVLLEPVFADHPGWKRFYLDLPGMGKTPAADWIASNDEMLDVVLRFIEKVSTGQRFTLIGYSYGGYLARGVVHKRSQLIDGLLLWNPVITNGKRTTPPPVTLVEDPAVSSQLTEHDKKAGYWSYFVVQSQGGLEYMRGWLPGFETMDHKFVKAKTGNNFSFDQNGFPERLDKPTLITCGRQDRDVGYHDQLRLIENYPRASFVILDRAGHFLGAPGEQEGLFKALVSDWLDRVEEALGFSKHRD